MESKWKLNYIFANYYFFYDYFCVPLLLTFSLTHRRPFYRGVTVTNILNTIKKVTFKVVRVDTCHVWQTTRGENIAFSQSARAYQFGQSRLATEVLPIARTPIKNQDSISLFTFCCWPITAAERYTRTGFCVYLKLSCWMMFVVTDI